MGAPDAKEAGLATGLASAFSADHSNFLTLLLTTPVSIFLLYATVTKARYLGGFYNFVVENRPLVQLGVQIIANLLSITQILVLCRLINFAVRRRFVDRRMDLDTLKMWISAVDHHMDWALPWTYWMPLLLFMTFSTALRGLWAAALTPVVLSSTVESSVVIPSWRNNTFIKEYPSEAWLQGATVQNERGRFSYSVATQLRVQIITGAATGTTLDGQPRRHGKMDNSRYTFIGRSYGVGSSAGLVVDDIENDARSLSYSYREDGYKTSVRCIYNETADYRIDGAGSGNSRDRGRLWNVQGRLPDSGSGPEWSVYASNEGNSIVAMGVAFFDKVDAEVLPIRKYVGFAAGETYDFLDKVQCEFDFVPARFAVAVDIKDRHITVTPTTEADEDYDYAEEEPTDIDPSRRLRGTAMRQFELMANDETNMYVSMFGNAFNASITDLKTYMAISGNPGGLSDSDLVLKAVGNSMTAMMDDMLSAYAAAQMMVSDFTRPIPAMVRRSAIGFGEFKFAIAVFSINVAIIATFLFEVIRTKWWRGLPAFDLSDVRMIAIAASEGGRTLGELARGKAVPELGCLMMQYESGPDGRYAIRANTMEKDEEGEVTPILTEMQALSRGDDRSSDTQSVASVQSWI